MADTQIQSIVVVGGGTAGWMAATALAKKMGVRINNITLIESPDIGTIGVGEATVPFIKEFLKSLAIDEIDFIKNTRATYKLAIDFDGWRKSGERFLHPFAGYGARIDSIPFHHFWIKMMQQNNAVELDAYCLASQIARQHKFAMSKPNQESDLSAFNYAFHLDAGLFAQYLSRIAQSFGVKKVVATVNHVNKHPDTGFIESVVLNTNETIHGDFFIDCTGFKGLLIEQELHTGYENWQKWLPCDRAIAIPSSSINDPAPYTRSLACEAGWQWKIPLQHRTGNGHVYCSNYISDECALTQLQNNLEGVVLGEPKFIKFTTGMRKQSWNKNVFAIGLSSGFMEPLESTSIYMIQESINVLIDNFPNKNWPSELIDETNKILRVRQEGLRDFLILHYYLNQRFGEKFWDDCRAMSIPDSLAHKIKVFKHAAQVPLEHLDFFRTNSWLAMFGGFGVTPDYYHPLVDNFDENLVAQELRNIAEGITNAVQKLPSHKAFIDANCSIFMSN